MNTIVTTPAMVDVSSYEGGADLARAVREGNVHAVMAKATQGRTLRDKRCAQHVAHARDAGARAGVYHFGSNSCRGDEQAKFHVRSLRAMVPGVPLVLSLDLENNPDPTGKTMTVENGDLYAAEIEQLTSKLPTLYTGQSWAGRIPKGTRALSRCPTWIAKYGPPYPHTPDSVQAWTWWQYSDGKDGPSDLVAFPRATPGIGKRDRSAFRGDLPAMLAWWDAHTVVIS